MNIRHFIYGSIGLFWIGTLAIVACGALANKNKARSELQPEETPYALQDVAEHATLEDCWLVIDGKVYNVTPYVSLHPAPPQVLSQYCGKEATQAYETKGGVGRGHSPGADEQLKEYQIGKL